MTKCSWKYVFGLFIGLLFMSAAGEAFATEGANAATEKKVETFVGATKLGDKKDQDVIDQVKQNCADAKKKVEDKEKGSARYWIGGILFGLGWALVGCCPGPIFILLGAGFFPVVLVLLGALLGTFVYGLFKDILPH